MAKRYCRMIILDTLPASGRVAEVSCVSKTRFCAVGMEACTHSTKSTMGSTASMATLRSHSTSPSVTVGMTAMRANEIPVSARTPARSVGTTFGSSDAAAPSAEGFSAFGWMLPPTEHASTSVWMGSVVAPNISARSMAARPA
eukprot:CAMPEP_0118946364 /NCGR_PEP_ID=MMETSP1169-20130426/44085_1 /TAXON_ID=36882 /ORGANISM="Pyramimonas obovata, Strain CCMP722" /LENGTH=142 /DNA_ID=CAMNT_0006892317 /DNA_START=122 /DNA_END=547 /DNA_ORIENTATION=+